MEKSKEFYLYIFLDQRKPGIWTYKNLTFNHQPFYIGVGCGYRMTAHFTPFNLKQNSLKNNIIKKIKKEIDELPLHSRIFERLTQEEAFILEKDIIKYFGKIKNKSGILSNITDGGDGNYGLVHSEEYLNGLRKPIYQYSLSGDFIKKFDTLKETGNMASIRRASRSNGTAGGFQWRYDYIEKLDPVKVKELKKRYTFVMSKNGKVIKEFNSKKEIEEYLNRTVSFGNLSMACTGGLKSYLGYTWSKYK